jgi:hypothetical protein
MKILTKNKIIESYHFPFSEALIFSILIWTSWGLAEAFYLHKISALLQGIPGTYDSYIYLEAFFMYVAIAGFFGTVIYIGMRLILAAFHLHNTITFRACTLSTILALFFAAALFFCIHHFISRSLLPQHWKYAVTAGLVFFAVFLTVLLYRYASGMDFRIRRSGTMMLSIFVISVVLTFIHFPLFTEQSPDPAAVSSPRGYQKTMGYFYFQHLL